MVAAYQEAADKMFQDADYKAKKDKILGKYEQVTGDAAAAKFDLATQVDPAARTWVQDWLTSKYNVKF